MTEDEAVLKVKHLLGVSDRPPPIPEARLYPLIRYVALASRAVGFAAGSAAMSGDLALYSEMGRIDRLMAAALAEVID